VGFDDDKSTFPVGPSLEGDSNISSVDGAVMAQQLSLTSSVLTFVEELDETTS